MLRCMLICTYKKHENNNNKPPLLLRKIHKVFGYDFFGSTLMYSLRTTVKKLYTRFFLPANVFPRIKLYTVLVTIFHRRWAIQIC